MTKKEVIERLCKLGSGVGEYKNHMHAHDCFCREGPEEYGFNFSEEVMKFIEEAVATKIENNKFYQIR